MNFIKKINWFFPILLSLLFTAACSEDDFKGASEGMGYVQLRLFPESAGAATRSAELEYLSDAKKIEVNLLYKDMPVSQSLTLSAENGGENFALTSEKLSLHSGEYKLISYIVYGAVRPESQQANVLARVYPETAIDIEVTQGHISEVELFIKAVTRGQISLKLEKDLSAFEEVMNDANTRSAATELPEEDFNYKNTSVADVYYRKAGTQEKPSMFTFKTYQGRWDNFFHTDTVSLPSGKYELTHFELFTKDRREMILAGDLENEIIEVPANKFAREKLTIAFPANMNSIADYIALYNIWTALDGENWYYTNQTFPMGANWRFKNRPVDEWGNQPGVELDGKGRVKALDLGSFGPKGDIPAALGQLTAIEVLWLGTHSDRNMIFENGTEYPKVIDTYQLYKNGVNLREKRMEIAKERTILRYGDKNRSKLFNAEKETNNFNFLSSYAGPTGTWASNEITSIPEEIGKLTKMHTLFIANNYVTELPKSIATLTNLTDVEIYNVKLKKFPEVLNNLSIASLNFSFNGTIPADEMLSGLNEFLRNAKELQLIYLNNNALREFPENFRYASKISLIDMSFNYVSELPNLDKAIAPVQLLMDNNKITYIDDNFCDTDDIEVFSVTNNQIKVFPNIFGGNLGAESKYKLATIDFSDNHIESFKEGFKGLYVENLNLSKNHFGKKSKLMPSELSKTHSKIDFLQFANNEIDSLPPSSFENLETLQALDLAGNQLRNIPWQFDVRTLPYLSSIELSRNSFEKFPISILYVQNLNKIFIAAQSHIKNGKEVRCLREWPKGFHKHPAVKYLDISMNDLRVVTEAEYPENLSVFDITDNPNIEMTVSNYGCRQIAGGYQQFYYDPTQYILGCAILDLE
ncbi:MAG: DUF4458 domain-containing protein [Bacteroidales bacterium]